MYPSNQFHPQATPVEESLHRQSHLSQDSYTETWVRIQRLYATGTQPLQRYVLLQQPTPGPSAADLQDSNQRISVLGADETTMVGTASRTADTPGNGATVFEDRLRRGPIIIRSDLDPVSYVPSQQATMGENFNVRAMNRLVATEQSIASPPRRHHTRAFPSHDTVAGERPMTPAPKRLSARAAPFYMPNRGSFPIYHRHLDMTDLQSPCHVLVPKPGSVVLPSSPFPGPCYEAIPQYYDFLPTYFKTPLENRLTTAALAQQQEEILCWQRRERRVLLSRQRATLESRQAGPEIAGQSSSRRGPLQSSPVQSTVGSSRSNSSSTSTPVTSALS